MRSFTPNEEASKMCSFGINSTIPRSFGVVSFKEVIIMARASIIKELLVKTKNRVGMMAEVTEAIGSSGVNITALNAFGIGKDNAMFRIVTSDNAKAINAIKAKKFEVSEKNVVSVKLENKPGAAADVGQKLEKAGIDINYIYGSTCDCGGPSIIVFDCSDNKKAVEILNK